MKTRTTLIVIIVTILISLLICSIPKKDLPTDQQWDEYLESINPTVEEVDPEWEAYLEYEKALYEAIDARVFD